MFESSAGARRSTGTSLSASSSPREKGLSVLDSVPAEGRSGDFHPLRAKMPDALGRRNEASLAIEKGLVAVPGTPETVYEAAALLVNYGHPEQALALLERTVAANPAVPELLSSRGLVPGVLGRAKDAEEALESVERRWPEFGRPYAALRSWRLPSPSRHTGRTGS